MRQDIPMLVFFRHHKCAGTWFHQICKQVSNKIGFNYAYLPQEMYHVSKTPTSSIINDFIKKNDINFFSYGNTPMQVVNGLKTFRGVNIIRDPRDILISAYFSHLYSHETNINPKIGKLRNKYQNVSQEEGLIIELEEFMPYVFKMMYNWDYSQKNVMEIKFEEITVNTVEVVPKIFEFLGLMEEYISYDDLLKIINENSFKKLSGGRSISQEDKRSHYRKGVSGDWKNYFTDKIKRRFKELNNELLIKLNYCNDGNW